MTAVWISRIIILSILTWNTLAKETDEQKLRKFLDPIFNKAKRTSDTRSLPFKRVTQLYSRNSARHIRVLPNKKIDALGEDGDKYAKLIIESDSFGRVRIRGSATNFYLCIDKRQRLRARDENKRATRNGMCINEEKKSKSE
ncbi:Fibroblast growth factor 8 [Exaiptasia diaphana]|nr:Fibroblast growth factor 8 [Exaiptasia diaphana]